MHKMGMQIININLVYNEQIQINLLIYNSYFRFITITEMGATFTKTSSIINKKFLKSLSQNIPLKNVQLEQTEVHQIFSHSIEQHKIILEKIRTKKAYDCPYIVKILDSHTLQSQNLCSTVIKTYIVVQKPESLAEEVDKRISIKMGFSQPEIWTLIYSCIIGGIYFTKNNVGLARLSVSNIYIDIAGNIKINDPQFTEGSNFFYRVHETEFIKSIYQIFVELKNVKQIYYSDKLLTLLTSMKNGLFDMLEIQNYIQNNYLEQKKKVNRITIIATGKKSLSSKSKQKKLRVLSGRKISNFSSKSNDPNETSAFTHYDTLTSYRCSNENKQNDSQNKIKDHKLHIQLFTFKDPLKTIQLNNKNLVTQHMFPKKALFGERKKMKQKTKQPLSCEFLQGFDRISNQEQNHRKLNQELQVDTELSLDSSQLMNIVSYQVDQQTSVREICQEKSEYILQLLNKCKYTAPSL